MTDFQVLDWMTYTRFQNENMSLEAMARAGVIKLRPLDLSPIKTAPKKRGRPVGSKNKKKS